ncbi:chemotaxis protein CheD [Bacillus sp. FJAT-47783]|uniref:chemotaxis protein CheD n=1 Tax=Bacillus sp. FJAT-47783 TaxID=2922712 RepID=UPI001FADD2AA|nr:chemotaxis protein CheD [Bacillus sp. FJAT-47783]
MNQRSTIVKVGIADLNFVTAPSTIRTSGLGSCVGVIIYHEKKKMAGLAHIMLPNSTLAKSETVNEAKYADTAISKLIHHFLAMGIPSCSLKAKMAGGSQMFSFRSTSDIMRIGPRNVASVKDELKKHGIPIISEDVGGNSGRTIEFNPETCKLYIRTVNKGVKEI